jgi:hypothetical protein
MSAADFLFLKHSVPHFSAMGVEWRSQFAEFVHGFVHWFPELAEGDPEQLRIAVATVADLCSGSTDRSEMVAEDCDVIFRLLGHPNPDIVAGCLIVVYELVSHVPALPLDGLPFDHVKLLVANDDPEVSTVAWEAVQVLRVLCEQRLAFALAADIPAFMVELVLATGCQQVRLGEPCAVLPASVERIFHVHLKQGYVESRVKLPGWRFC